MMDIPNFANILKDRKALIGGGVVLIALTLLFAFGGTKEEAPPGEVLSEETDVTLGQYHDRPSASPPAQGGGSTPSEPLDAGCSLRFSLTPVSKAVAAGGTIMYAIRLANMGDEACENASFSVYYGEGETYESSTPAPTASDYYWNAGTLAPRAVYDVALTTRAGEGGSANDACATADNSAGDVCAQNAVYAGTPASSGVAAAFPAMSSFLRGLAGASKITVPSGKEYGTWIWDPPGEQSAGYADAALSAAAANGFNAVYLTTDDYLEIAALPEGADKAARKAAYFAKLAAFIALANAKGIAVDAEGGARDWGEASERWKGYALITMAEEYNRAHPEARLRGFQYDVEAYLIPGYDGDKANLLRNFVGLIDESEKRTRAAGLRFSVVVPHFYDATQAWTPAFSYGGANRHTLSHLLPILARSSGSSLIVMSYRDYLDGDNGTREISSAELSEAAGTGVSVIVAQETGNVTPDFVTFYGGGKRAALDAFAGIFSAFSGESAFGGVAVHYLDPFLALE